MRGSSSILDTFPIVRRPDQAAFGLNCAKKKSLAYDNTLGGGDTETATAVSAASPSITRFCLHVTANR